MKKIPLIALALAACSAALADYSVTSTTSTVKFDAKKAKGAELREAVMAAGELIQQRRLDEAEKALIELKPQFESKFDRRLRQVTFQSQAEYEEFKATANDSFEWIDWSYVQCLFFRAYIFSERKEFDKALEMLSGLERLAPLSSDVPREIGYALNQLGKFEEGLAAYTRAFDLSKRSAAQRPLQGAIVRGMAFSLGEMRRFDEAEAKYRESLELEPENKIALSEIEYLQKQQKRKR